MAHLAQYRSGQHAGQMDLAPDDGKDAADMAVKWKVLFFICGVVYTGIVAGGSYFAGQWNTERMDANERVGLEQEAEAEYYRGLYDGCMQTFKKSVGAPEICGQVIQSTYKSDWYGKASLEWRWPIVKKKEKRG